MPLSVELATTGPSAPSPRGIRGAAVIATIEVGRELAPANANGSTARKGAHVSSAAPAVTSRPDPLRRGPRTDPGPLGLSRPCLKALPLDTVTPLMGVPGRADTPGDRPLEALSSAVGRAGQQSNVTNVSFMRGDAALPTTGRER